MEATWEPAAAVTRRLQDDPDQAGQESQRCNQKDVEEGRGEQRGRGPAAGGQTVEEDKEVEMLVGKDAGLHVMGDRTVQTPEWFEAFIKPCVDIYSRDQQVLPSGPPKTMSVSQTSPATGHRTLTTL